MRKLEKDLTDEVLKEDLFWSQKACLDWLKAGDKNTTFFHTKVIQRRQRNHILKIQDERGRWTSSFNDITNVSVHYLIACTPTLG